jgi:cytochrome c oxidase subunit 2
LVDILPGDMGLAAPFLALIFVVITAGVLIMLGVIFWSTRHPDERRRFDWPKRERLYTTVVLIVVLFFVSSTLGLFPYPYAHSNVKPTMDVNVLAYQFQWCIAPTPNWGTQCQADMVIPSGSIVLFNVTSLDVTHGFGLYSSSGELLDQVQVMPGYYNSIIFHFTKAGTYYIRCLEFCGFGHFGMVSQLNVTST